METTSPTAGRTEQQQISVTTAKLALVQRKVTEWKRLSKTRWAVVTNDARNAILPDPEGALKSV